MTKKPRKPLNTYRHCRYFLLHSYSKRVYLSLHSRWLGDSPRMLRGTVWPNLMWRGHIVTCLYTPLIAICWGWSSATSSMWTCLYPLAFDQLRSSLTLLRKWWNVPCWLHTRYQIDTITLMISSLRTLQSQPRVSITRILPRKFVNLVNNICKFCKQYLQVLGFLESCATERSFNH